MLKKGFWYNFSHLFQEWNWAKIVSFIQKGWFWYGGVDFIKNKMYLGVVGLKKNYIPNSEWMQYHMLQV